MSRLKSMPKKTVFYKDNSESYEMDRVWVLLLESGQYAGVFECGCSCYESSDANIDLYPSKAKAMDAVNKWRKRYD